VIFPSATLYALFLIQKPLTTEGHRVTQQSFTEEQLARNRREQAGVNQRLELLVVGLEMHLQF
jgi:hypothetical protein